ncbi:hypothetical protein RhiirA1_454102 [Rhizophagus irregularis]|uniref:Uncharacterized protein n=1 Tax=Rhizophagus irregularis TaxID=588596 RepID=A0A2I1EF78_9GLOM|nr:hypothetical protein RhiirA1_454102 [Rhizophagus irregularis]PKY20789.1 hypothetical protein RhiirB3_434191 [Rhizophagus irregularis]GET58528.1 hypothetical protein RIR_jg14264.t1 [Rhizophagus irregularis DAOM 181602=DAOM 197198]CAG8666981.1 6741_t:CDS:2 [Rhizophagus irregularis]
MSNSFNVRLDIANTKEIRWRKSLFKKSDCIDLTHNHNLVPLQLIKFMPDNRNIKDKILGLPMAGTTI